MPEDEDWERTWKAMVPEEYRWEVEQEVEVEEEEEGEGGGGEDSLVVGQQVSYWGPILTSLMRTCRGCYSTITSNEWAVKACKMWGWHRAWWQAHQLKDEPGPMVDSQAFHQAADQVAGKHLTGASARLLQTVFEGHIEALVDAGRTVSPLTPPEKTWNDKWNDERKVMDWMEFEVEGKHLRMGALIKYNLRPLTRLLICGR